MNENIDLTKILKNCPNYDIIVNSEFPFEDTFSDKLVDWYRELVFSANGNNEGQLKIINALDKSIYLYVTNNRYKRGLRKIVDENEITLKDKEIIKELLKKIINYTNSYENKTLLEIDTTKWI